MIRILCCIAILLLTSTAGFAMEGLSVSAGPMVSNLAPVDSVYENRFLTPGTSAGISVDVTAPGILGFRVTGEYFWKNSSPTGWDGDLDALIVSVMPVLKKNVYRQFSVFAGAGGVYINGRYSGSDDFGDYVEVQGGSAGFVLSAGVEVGLAGPVSGRLEYRRSFADYKTDNAVIDGLESQVYPAAEAELGSSQFCITFPLSLFGDDNSIF